MYHIFLTRLALDLRNRAQYRSFSPEHIAKIIDFWHRFGSKFYEAQTVKRPFEIRLLYDSYYSGMVLSYSYPKWAKLCPARKDMPYRFDKMPSYRPLAIHRVDADDQYSLDFFQRFEDRFINYSGVVLHRFYVQYNVNSQQTSQVLRNKSPHFLSVVIQHPDPVTLEDFQPLITDHGRIIKLFHYEHSDILDVLALETVGRRNVCNRWSNKNPSKELHPRFAYYGKYKTKIDK